MTPLRGGTRKYCDMDPAGQFVTAMGLLASIMDGITLHVHSRVGRCLIGAEYKFYEMIHMICAAVDQHITY